LTLFEPSPFNSVGQLEQTMSRVAPLGKRVRKRGKPATFLQLIRNIICIATSFCRQPRDPPGAVGAFAQPLDRYSSLDPMIPSPFGMVWPDQTEDSGYVHLGIAMSEEFAGISCNPFAVDLTNTPN
jgi:hypothetical protein